VRIAAACRNASVVALDERGEPWTTRVLADKLARWRVEARDVAFVIGSATVSRSPSSAALLPRSRFPR
jgi:23S rRNA pseudoU1915 N3-methylase RlmH